MKQFKDFGIKPVIDGYVGDKIKIERVLNREIVIHKHRIVKSKYDGNRLDMQIELEGVKRVLWTSSKTLMSLISQVPTDGFPFRTTIVKEDEHLEFK